MKIRGANLGEQDGEYKPLSEYPFFKDERQQIVKKLEQLYFSVLEETKEITLNPFPQGDGKVQIIPGTINHRCSSAIDTLKSIAEYGVLASEWFGHIESEREGVFCTFVDKIHSEEKSSNKAEILNNQRLRTMGNNVILFFDSIHPVMRKLLHLDYFEYEKIKQQTPEKLTEKYTSEEIEILEEIIAPFSPCGREYHIKNFLPYCDWSAIPGGIPASLINGICTKRIAVDKDYIEEVSRLFPNATIFNGDLEILHTPQIYKSTQELGYETLTEQNDTGEKDKTTKDMEQHIKIQETYKDTQNK